MSHASAVVRKKPVQARSRARVETILNVAKEIIAEVGSDGLKMNALAQRADVPIGTVYQFFPNKSAVIHTLVTATMEQTRAGLEAQFEDIQSLEDAATRIDQAVRGYYQFLKEEPIVSSILGSTQGDKKLQALDQEDSRLNGAMMFDRLKKFVAQEDHDRLSVMLFLNAHLTGSLTRLAAMEDAGIAEKLQQTFIASVQRDLTAFSPASS